MWWYFSKPPLLIKDNKEDSASLHSVIVIALEWAAGFRNGTIESTHSNNSRNMFFSYPPGMELLFLIKFLIPSSPCPRDGGIQIPFF